MRIIDALGLGVDLEFWCMTQYQPAYILHTYHYRDTSLLVDALTPLQGRVSLIAKAARQAPSRRSHFKGLLQAFVPLLIAWRGKTDLLTLSRAEPGGPLLPPLTGEGLLCGLYLNELLVRLLHRHDPHPALFWSYQTALSMLSQDTHHNLTLRLFEKRLLAELGYALDLSHDSQTRQAVRPDQHYQFVPGQGFTLCSETLVPRSSVFSGTSLLAAYHEQWTEIVHLSDAKRLFRLAIHDLLGGRPIRSRELFPAVPSLTDHRICEKGNTSY